MIAAGQWMTIAECDYDELETTTPAVSELPKGTVFRIYVETHWWAPVAPLFDLGGAEWVADALWQVGGDLRDVWGEGWHTVVMECVADPVWVWALLGALATILAGVAGVIAVIRLTAWFQESVSPIVSIMPELMTLMALGALLILPGLLTGEE